MATENETDSSRMSVGEDPDFAAMRDAVELRHGHYFMLATILFFQIVNWRVKSQGPPKSLADDEWKWRNLYVSWVHAIITSVWVVISTLVYPELFANVMQHITYFTFFCVCFATGYFIYDFLDVIWNNKLMSNWEVGFHHVLVVSMFYYNIHIKSHIAFNIVALLIEINSVFLHWRKLLQMVKKPFDSREYLIVKYLNLITFFLFRGGVLLAISTCCYFWRHKVTVYYYIGIVVTIFLLDILNTILFWRLLKSDVLRGSSSVCSTLKREWSMISGGVSVSSESHSNGHVLTGNNNIPDAGKSYKKEE